MREVSASKSEQVSLGSLYGEQKQAAPESDSAQPKTDVKNRVAASCSHSAFFLSFFFSLLTDNKTTQ